jgi:hypothetical protein
MDKIKVQGKNPNRCDVCVGVYLSNVPIGLASEDYLEFLKDDMRDGALHISDHETVEAWYDADHEDARDYKKGEVNE